MKEHKFITIERIFKNGIVNFGRNIYLSIAAIAMMAITLTILLFAIITNATFNHSVQDITDHIDVTISLNDSITDQDRNNLTHQLEGLPNVASVAYKSKVDALNDYEQQNANNPTALQAIQETGNVLPASLVIKPRDPYKTQEIKDFLDKPEVAKFYSFSSYADARKAAIDKITKATHFFQQAGIVGIIVFILISTMIIFNTIRMAIFNRREELVIMRLLGATTWYIRGPFVVETVLYGVVAAAVSIFVCWALFVVASSTLEASTLGLLDITYSNIFFKHHLWVIILAQIGAGIIIGAASSIIATRRYLKLNK